MAEQDANPESTEADGQSLSAPARLRAWAAGNPLRSAIIGGGLLLLSVGTIVAWAVLASLAVPQHVATLDEALEALDAGDHDLARLRANRLRVEPDRLGPGEHGGPLYVLGVLKAVEADQQALPARAQGLYEVAALYLADARRLGVPDERDIDSLYQLGRTLAESGQYQKGIEALDEALLLDPNHAGEIHRLLGEAHFYDAKPDSDEVLDHLTQAIESGELAGIRLGGAHFKRALTLGRLGRFEAGLAELEAASELIDVAMRWYATAQLRVAQIEASAGPEGLVAESNPLIPAAERALDEARRADRLSSPITAGVYYLRGRLRERQGFLDEAIDFYTKVRQEFGTTSEAIAASLAEADLLRLRQRTNEALDAYRRTAAAARDEANYRSDLLPLRELHDRFIAAKGAFTANGQFAAALSLVEHLSGLFDQAKRLELQAAALETWGSDLLDRASRDRQPSEEVLREGRRRLREAGISFEQLAESRYATSEYTDHLWSAADAYTRGHSFSKAAQVLNEYLKNEPRKRNALALQKLGQAYLAMGRPAEAIEVFDEGIEFFPLDAAAYQSRLDAARAYRVLGQSEHAEKLLRENLIGATLTPQSPEWRESLFELGELLHDQQRWEDAIISLEDAIAWEQQQPTFNDRQQSKQRVKLAKYLIAEANRNAAQKPLEEYEQAKAVNERQRVRAELERYLEEAIRYYSDVQREITLHGDNTDLDRAMLRNCYMLRGSALFDLGRYEEAVRVFSNVSTQYQSQPFVLETLVQVAHCWRRIGDPPKARGAIEQAIQALDRLPVNADLLATTSHTRPQWAALLADLREW